MRRYIFGMFFFWNSANKLVSLLVLFPAIVSSGFRELLTSSPFPPDGGCPRARCIRGGGTVCGAAPPQLPQGLGPRPRRPSIIPPILRLWRTSWWGEVFDKLCYSNERVGKEGGYGNISLLSPSVTALVPQSASKRSGGGADSILGIQLPQGNQGGMGGGPISPMHSIRISLHAIR